MSIITYQTEKSKIKNTVLEISFNEDIGEDLGNVFPYPNKHYVDNLKIVYYWYIDGYFHTKKGFEYINDIKSRFLITYKEKINHTKHYKTDKKSTYNLKHFQNLKSKTISIINHTNRYDNSNDFVFWCLKLYAEEIIIERGIIQYETLLDFGALNFYNEDKKVKDFSTLKSKCRSIVNYYVNKNYKLDKYERKLTDEEYKMSRSKNMKKVKEQQKKQTQLKIKNFMSGMFIDEYKKPNGSWNKSKICKDLGISRPTLDLHLKELEL